MTTLKKHNHFWLFILLLSVAIESSAQNNNCVTLCPVITVKKIKYTPPPPDTTTPVPQQKVQKSFREFDDYLNENSSNYDNNLLAYVSNDTMYYQYQRGQYSADEALPIASATKWLTAAVIMSLVDANKLSLTDNVGQYIPSFNDHGKGNITIKQIFSHTSGIQVDTRFDQRDEISLQAAIDSIAIYTDLLFSPGTQARYGSSAYKIAARIAEIVEGKPWEQIFQERIATKCEMINTSYGTTPNPHAGAGVRGSMNDYIKFLSMIHGFGKYKNVRVLSESAVKTMELDQSNGIDTFYGLGVWRYDILNNIAREVSSPSAMGIHPWVNREKGYFGIIFTQAGFDKTINYNLTFRGIVKSKL